MLNHRPEHFELGEPSAVKTYFKIKPLGQHSGRGEDYPIWDIKLKRDGWVDVGKIAKINQKIRKRNFGSYAKDSPKDSLFLLMSIDIVHEPNTPWFHTEYDVCLLNGDTILHLKKTDWADWDKNGDLLFARNGCIYRLYRRDLKKKPDLDTARLLIDLNPNKFTEMKAPHGYHMW